MQRMGQRLPLVAWWIREDFFGSVEDRIARIDDAIESHRAFRYGNKVLVQTSPALRG
jgi:hypothetical protein